jgi:hypothetical protein
MKQLVAISGKIASGKTTVSDYFVREYEYQRVSFSSPFKWIVEHWYKTQYNTMFADERGYYTGLFEKMDLQIHLSQVCDSPVSANKAYNILMYEIFPSTPDIDWEVEKNLEWRQLLQRVGNTLRDQVDPDIWVKALVRSLSPGNLYICDDVRYPNEYFGLEEAGFVNIRLDISPEEQARRIKRKYGELPRERLEHISEVALDNHPFPYRVNADMPLADVINEVSIITQMGDMDDSY